MRVHPSLTSVHLTIILQCNHLWLQCAYFHNQQPRPTPEAQYLHVLEKGLEAHRLT